MWLMLNKKVEAIIILVSFSFDYLLTQYRYFSWKLKPVITMFKINNTIAEQDSALVKINKLPHKS